MRTSFRWFQSRNRETSIFNLHIRFPSFPCVRVSISQSRNFYFQLWWRGGVLDHRLPGFQSRNRETSIFNRKKGKGSPYPLMTFQSRNRETSIFNCNVACPYCKRDCQFIVSISQSRNFYFQLKILVARPINNKIVSISQSRNFYFQLPRRYQTPRWAHSFNLAIEKLLFSTRST